MLESILLVNIEDSIMGIEDVEVGMKVKIVETDSGDLRYGVTVGMTGIVATKHTDIITVKLPSLGYNYSLNPEQLEIVEDSFKSQQEIWEYLVNGGTIETNNGTYRFKDGYIVNSKGIRVGLYFRNPKDFKKHINWYDNIPEEGILCWGWDSEDEKDIFICKVYDPEGDYKYRNSLDGSGEGYYRHARPIKEGDLTFYES